MPSSARARVELRNAHASTIEKMRFIRGDSFHEEMRAKRGQLGNWAIKQTLKYTPVTAAGAKRSRERLERAAVFRYKKRLPSARRLRTGYANSAGNERSNAWPHCKSRAQRTRRSRRNQLQDLLHRRRSGRSGLPWHRYSRVGRPLEL